MADAGVAWSDIQDTACGACMVDGFVGNRVGQMFGLTGSPIVNIDNASASGTSAFRHAYLAVAEGRAEIALALGVGRMGKKMLNLGGNDPEVIHQDAAMAEGNAAPLFGLLAQRRIADYDTKPDTFAKVAVKARAYAAQHPYAHRRTPVTLEEVLASPLLADPIRLLEACPVGDGAAAAVIMSREMAERRQVHQPVRIVHSLMVGEFFDPVPFPGKETTRVAAGRSYEATGIGPEDLDVIQVHDAFSAEELEYYEALGLCADGDAERLVADGETGPGGRIPCNTDGGLIARGHPLGPTGLAQVWEIVQQLRGSAGPRQVDGAKTGLIQMIGAGTVSFIHILQR